MSVTRLPPNPSAEQLEKAYSEGLLRKDALVDGQYYRGRCRNTSVAVWSARTQRFLYIRSKFGESFVECILHPADERHYDAFLVEGLAEPTEEQRLSEASWSRWHEANRGG